VELLSGALVLALALALRAVARGARQRQALGEELAAARRTAATDAAERQRLETLSRSLSQSLETLSLGVIVVDHDGDVLSRNASADALVGARPGDALAARAVSDLLAAAQASGTRSRTIELYGPPRRTLDLSAVSLGDDPAGAVAVIIEDVSNRKRLDAVRRDFVANVSHELKTPVAALGLLAETLIGEADLSVVQRLAERMNTEAFRVAAIIEDLLDLSRLEAEQSPVHERVTVQAVVTQAVDQVRPAASLAGVTVEVAEVGSSWAVRGDRRQLVSALANLLENAVKYSNPGSKVDLLVRNENGSIELDVRDHGIGIPSRDLDRIFERFYRVDRGRGRDTGGTGLGLSIVRHVATNHGGDVEVDSHEGEGSVFRLRLPAEIGSVGLMATAG